MFVWLTGALVCGWPPQVHRQGVFEDCCLAYHYPIGWAVLRHAWTYRIQEVSGSCNLPAAIFYLPKRHRKVCGNPKNKEVQRAMKLLDARNKIFAKFRHNTQTFPAGPHAAKKLSSANSKLPSSKFSNPTSSSKRNASLLTSANSGKDSWSCDRLPSITFAEG
uniref:Chemokine interleukin-8-like domain-containing protein n=1 Tax=Mandrillus leucophaeus TaxID=9568 RepID=A0A2K5ZLM2_MANLE